MSNKLVKAKRPWKGKSVHQFYVINGTIFGFTYQADTKENRKKCEEFMEEQFGHNPSIVIPAEEYTGQGMR